METTVVLAIGIVVLGCGFVAKEIWEKWSPWITLVAGLATGGCVGYILFNLPY